MKVAITGASGFLGRETVESLLKKGDRVVAVGRNPPPGFERGGNLVFFESAYDFESLRRAFEGADAVLHLAARRLSDPAEGLAPLLESNLRTTENTVRAALACGIKRFVFASSISVYSLSGNSLPFTESQNPQPENFYGLSKRAGEHLIQIYSRNTPMRTLILRFGTLFGRGDAVGENFTVSVFIRQAVQKQPLQVWGQGKGGRDLLYVRDAVEAIEKALSPGASAGVFNVGAGKSYSYLEIAETVNEVFGNAGNLTFDMGRKADPNHYWMDGSLAESQLNWRPKRSLREGLQDMKGSRT